ncbi:hypothetical protein P5673_032841 [Acropora cervicornis]|uniref:Uncharacterized protein n=1 Tax=Acropora cervicornis TaxID=6130 RepID=A0AAD9PQQ1_ACRCE|nr:hypothetical protein P5673_032841 [Acropora cervicornis]
MGFKARLVKSYEEAMQISEETAKVKQAPVEPLQEAKKEHRSSSLASKGREPGLVFSRHHSRGYLRSRRTLD